MKLPYGIIMSASAFDRNLIVRWKPLNRLYIKEA